MTSDADKVIREKIKKTLRVYTDEFSSEDVEFLFGLEYPKMIDIFNLAVETESPDYRRKLEVDNLGELLKAIKRLHGDYLVVIEDITGKMKLISRVDK